MKKEMEMTKGNGDVSFMPMKDGPKGVIEAGDYVRIRMSALDKVEMTPKVLLNAGHPNEFLVLGTFDHEGKRCLTFEECCEWYRNRATGQYLCTGHHEVYFEKTEPFEHERSRERRHFALEIFGQQALAVDYLDDPTKPALLMKLPGLRDKVALSGKVARDIAKMAKDLGIL